jgi:RNA polymerase sigma-70 factor, ECF subfamily
VKVVMSLSEFHQPSEVFIRALTAHQAAIRGYCQASLGNADEAKEALQRTSIVLWRKCGDWNPATDFLPWAITVAKFEVLGVVRDRNRLHARFVFDPDVVDLMTDEASQSANSISPRAEALEICLEKLSDPNRESLSAYYVHGRSILEIADASGKGPSAVKVMLLRLRGKLRECIEDRLAKGGVA